MLRRTEFKLKKGEQFKNIVGKGVQATIDGKVYYAGNTKLFEERNISLDSVKNELEEIQIQGKTGVIIGTETEIVGVISVADTIRKATINALNGLKKCRHKPCRYADRR